MSDRSRRIPPIWVEPFLLTLISLVAFAANSLLCRLALADDHIDPFSFTALRLFAGAILLTLLVGGQNLPRQLVGGSESWSASSWLFVYALAFSIAYMSLTAATGALILFASVQVTMVSAALIGGDRLRPAQWTGLAGASGGLVVLVMPGIARPSLLGLVLMTASGIAWGLYTLKGRRASDPLLTTAGNFLLTLPACAVLLIIAIGFGHTDRFGALLAVVSGAATSGIGYAIWYRVLPRLTSTVAGVVQLAVPVFAAVGGIVFLEEAVSIRLLLASALVLGGIGLVITSDAMARRRI